MLFFSVSINAHKKKFIVIRNCEMEALIFVALNKI